MRIFALCQRMSIEGIMPERALLKLRRAGIDLYDVKKPQKNRLDFTVAQKDMQKVFAIYPNLCYNTGGYSPYTAKSLGAVGIAKCLAFVFKRIGIILGALIFLGGTLILDEFVFGVDFVGSAIYAREARITLAEYGIKPFAKYKSGNEDLICAKLLSLDGVEFCSVKKNGLRVRVEMRLGETGGYRLQSGDLTAKHTGEIIAITALRGTPLKAKGDEVNAGEAIVGGWFINGEEKVQVEVIARVSIACLHEAEYSADTKEQAFATAYLALGLCDEEITSLQVKESENGYLVRLEYIAIESINF